MCRMYAKAECKYKNKQGIEGQTRANNSKQRRDGKKNTKRNNIRNGKELYRQ